MGTIPRPPRAGMPVPPPPAPTSRDANPWEMSASRVASRPPSIPPSSRQQVGLRWLPFAIIGGVFIAVGGNALESLRRGDVIGALVPLVFVGFIAFGALRNLLRRRS
jgi:hypothetical protein